MLFWASRAGETAAETDDEMLLLSECERVEEGSPRSAIAPLVCKACASRRTGSMGIESAIKSNTVYTQVVTRRCEEEEGPQRRMYAEVYAVRG